MPVLLVHAIRVVDNNEECVKGVSDNTYTAMIFQQIHFCANNTYKFSLCGVKPQPFQCETC